MNYLKGVMALLAMITLATPALSKASNQATPGQSAGQAAMTEFAKTRPPVGYIQFCATFPQDCGTALPQTMRLTQARWAELNDINDTVNNMIQPVTDAELYRVEERWTYPVNKGDCEDYVLLKRRMLMNRGWSAANLLITVVRDRRGDGHAVLTVRTDHGDLILDNQVSTIHYWTQTDYRFEKRQSAANPTAWVWLRNDRARGAILAVSRSE